MDSPQLNPNVPPKKTWVENTFYFIDTENKGYLLKKEILEFIEN